MCFISPVVCEPDKNGLYPLFSKKITFCLDTKSNKKIKAKQEDSFYWIFLLVLPCENQKLVSCRGCDLLSNYGVA